MFLSSSVLLCILVTLEVFLQTYVSAHDLEHRKNVDDEYSEALEVVVKWEDPWRMLPEAEVAAILMNEKLKEPSSVLQDKDENIVDIHYNCHCYNQFLFALSFSILLLAGQEYSFHLGWGLISIRSTSPSIREQHASVSFWQKIKNSVSAYIHRKIDLNPEIKSNANDDENRISRETEKKATLKSLKNFKSHNESDNKIKKENIDKEDTIFNSLLKESMYCPKSNIVQMNVDEKSIDTKSLLDKIHDDEKLPEDEKKIQPSVDYTKNVNLNKLLQNNLNEEFGTKIFSDKIPTDEKILEEKEKVLENTKYVNNVNSSQLSQKNLDEEFDTKIFSDKISTDEKLPEEKEKVLEYTTVNSSQLSQKKNYKNIFR
ncbi:hypothetical protein CEXT_244001 [Caerostris extrusa]|uniref:Uncharacterized protein n=1 Tax=Caerostris extrusa TaxID=172846 RepID=A0AAV4R9Z6_CAEEX|nr:hypothetical protein CEXT_244001 [Caerostris extrusa]